MKRLGSIVESVRGAKGSAAQPLNGPRKMGAVAFTAIVLIVLVVVVAVIM